VASFALLAAMFGAGCGSGSQPAPTPAPAAQVTTTVAAAEPMALCASFDGASTDVVAEHFQTVRLCSRGVVDGQFRIVDTSGVASSDCVDGSTLYWNGEGWGLSPGTWTASRSGLPPNQVIVTCEEGGSNN
jgi:hypothetical protein